VSPLENAAGVEYATTPSMAAARSLAKAAGVSGDVALQHLRNGTARVLIESRVANRKAEEGHLARIRRLYDLKVRGIILGGG
jgi:hypothetical protein